MRSRIAPRGLSLTDQTPHLVRCDERYCQTRMRPINDEISGWLEDHLRPTIETSRREFRWQYLVIYDRWAQYHAAHKDLDAQTSLTHLVQTAEDALREIAAPKPTRLWLNVVRSVPLPVVAHIAMSQEPAYVIELVKITSAAAALYGDRQPDMLDDQNSLQVSPEWLMAFKGSLATDVPRFIGAAHARYFARGWYRIAGKGGVLAPPDWLT